MSTTVNMQTETRPMHGPGPGQGRQAIGHHLLASFSAKDDASS